MAKKGPSAVRDKHLFWDELQCNEIQRWADAQNISFTDAVFRLCEFALSAQHDKEYARYFNASVSEMRNSLDAQLHQISVSLETLSGNIEILTRALLEEEDGEY